MGITWDGTLYVVSNPGGYGGGTQGIMEFDANGNFITEVELPNHGSQPFPPSVGPFTIVSTSDPSNKWPLENLAAVTSGRHTLCSRTGIRDAPRYRGSPVEPPLSPAAAEVGGSVTRCGSKLVTLPSSPRR